MIEATKSCFSVISRSKRSLYLRCSRPLCSSQNTGGTPRAWLCREAEYVPVNKRVQRFVSPCFPAVNADGTGARSLRTQQRAKTRLPAGSRSYSRGNVLRRRRSSWSQCQCSTHERHRRTCASEMATRLIALYTDASSSAP